MVVISLECLIVAAADCGAVQPTGDITERRPKAEIRTGRHDQDRCNLNGITRPLRAVAADRSRRRAPAAAIADQARPAWRRTSSTSRLRRAKREVAECDRG